EQQRWIKAGELRIVAARLLRVRVEGDGLALDLRRQGQAQVDTLNAQRLLRATGIDGPLQRGVDPLVDSLIAQGLVRAHPLGLGLQVDEHNRVLDVQGRAVPGLYAVGALARGLLWETTAIPELRQRAAVVAAAIS
ncbi:MAG TPA: FAD-binding protein, partial [Pseudomonadota bacterium]|nr:FAD-binding protein [Pseudomonadota bacterium]